MSEKKRNLTEGTRWRLAHGQRQLEAMLQDFNKIPSTTNHFGTEGPGLVIDPIGFEHVPVGFTDPWRTDMFESDKTETSELGQGSFNPTWTDSIISGNSNGNNSVLRVATTSTAPGSSRECSCITCLDLGSWNASYTEPDPDHYPCRLSDCNVSTVVGPEAGNYFSYMEPNVLFANTKRVISATRVNSDAKKTAVSMARNDGPT